MLIVIYPPTYLVERQYIFDVVLSQFLGLKYQYQIEERSDVCIKLTEDHWERELRIADILFQTPEERWLNEFSLPSQPLDWWDLSDIIFCDTTVTPEVPVIYGSRLSSGSFLVRRENGMDLGVDIFGSSFFMLTRYEEAVKPDRDSRERFPAAASLAFQEGFLTRPIVNEYVEILWRALKHLWPGLKRKERTFVVRLSHDVDWPLCTYEKTLVQVFRNIAGDVIKTRSPDLALRRFLSYHRVRLGNFDADICNTFDTIMDLSERNGLYSAFYFITEHGDNQINGIYSIDHPWIRKLMRRIHDRNHEIGLHPSYNTIHDPSQLSREFQNLLRVCESEGIQQEVWGGRQHYLRWNVPTTWQDWEDVGLDYDSTLVFADHAGFRCGVCYEFNVFNLHARRPLDLIERPLIVMDSTVLAKNYMNLSHEQARVEIARLIKNCKIFRGDFTLLWHNSHFIDRRECQLYQDIVNGIKN
ncbi:MAG: hypothetical protein FH756_16320 [Firmicutes bacterium]|nr:hypothetical protein [Bacillota bacterium]